MSNETLTWLHNHCLFLHHVTVANSTRFMFLNVQCNQYILAVQGVCKVSRTMMHWLKGGLQRRYGSSVIIPLLCGPRTKLKIRLEGRPTSASEFKWVRLNKLMEISQNSPLLFSALLHRQPCLDDEFESLLALAKDEWDTPQAVRKPHYWP